jgi:putative salt-induced outer membrane protein YdiY
MPIMWFRRVQALDLLCAVLLAAAAPASAQTPAAPATPPPPPGWTGSFGAGLALTQGNSDTSTVNIAYDVRRDTGSPVLFKSTGLFIRGSSEGTLTTNRLLLDGRVDRRLNARTSLFGQLQYFRDEFKRIDYVASPTVGLAHLLVRTDRTELGADGGAGVVWEKNPGRPVQASGAVTASETFKHKVSSTAEITQRVSALWKTNDFDDALYVLGLGLAANVTTATQFKAELLDTFKTRPPSAAVKKNDVAVLLSLVYKY